ncbi:hypothetical protein DL96DRAFT_1596877 [Flagelloscypha sp. PMI_526]|nr:hypothetical protein DL96DRAFT_1596877 [Flagelloscypha sp. PMI_526]
MAMFSQMSNVSKTSETGQDISDIFTSLSDTGGQGPVLPDRFTQLKKDIFREELIQCWKDIVDELEVTTNKVITAGSNMIPRYSYDEIRSGLSEEQAKVIKDVGSVVITGAVSPELYRGNRPVRTYIDQNKERVKGFPSNDIQIYELYNTRSQILARTNPAILDSQRILIRADTSFAVGSAHTDAGGVELWEDPGFRAFYARIFEGKWREHDPFDADKRVDVVSDMYHVSKRCSVFRTFQGWTSMSTTGPGEGSLRVLPFLKLSSAYLLLRPFFRPSPSNPNSLKDWELNLDTPHFPGAAIGKTQELNHNTHPHLRLNETMLRIPQVQPGDQVYWHCDVIHAVDTLQGGKSDASVLYIPAVPLTVKKGMHLCKELHQRMSVYWSLRILHFTISQ